jgi:hypothetical protein
VGTRIIGRGVIRMYTAHVKFYKDVERDNYSKGCYGGVRGVYDDKFSVEFENTEDLKRRLAEWTSSRFAVRVDTFLKYVENECEPNRFDYAQPEDDDGNFKHITEDDPEGWYAMYFYHIEVFKPVSYDF